MKWKIVKMMDMILDFNLLYAFWGYLMCLNGNKLYFFL
jgi:hypothetical protein